MCLLQRSLPSLVCLQHERDVLVRSIIFQFTEAHGANMDAAGTNDARNLGVDESCVTALSLRACDSTMSSTVVVQELFWEVAARNCDSCTSSDIAINQECAILTQGAEPRQDILATSDHLIGSSAVMLARKVWMHVSSTQARVAFATSGLHLFIWQKTGCPEAHRS
jgi:hypothetical protein